MGEDSAVARYTSEFVGTYLLVFTVGCNVISGDPTWNATSIACVLMVSIYALGAVSGANFNPAVSLALALSNKLPWVEAGIYMGVQILAGILAALSYGALFWEVFNLGPGAKAGATKDDPAIPYTWWQAGLAEVLYTFMLCFVVLNVATAKKNEPNQYFGLAIGFVIIAGGYAAGGISGGAFNPAVAIGIDTSSAGLGFGWCFAYAAFEFLGAALAAGLFRVVRPDEFGGSSEYGLPAKLCSEFLGTFYLVLTVGLNVLGKSPAAVWSIAASLMCMIYALGTCSGAHFNPAVTLAILASGRGLITVVEAAAYMGVQIVGGICAAFMYAALQHGETFFLAPQEGFGWGHAAVAEIVFTFVLCYVVLCVATVKEPSKDFFGLAIASCVTAGGYAIGAVSGGSLNPAVSFGISSANIMNGGLFYNCLIYTVYEFIGAGLAAGIFMATHPTEYNKE
jgi:aquaporin Z